MAEVSIVTPNTSEESAVTTILSTNSNWTAAATGLYVDIGDYKDGEVGLAVRIADAASSSDGTASVTVYAGGAGASTDGTGYWRNSVGNLSYSVTYPVSTASGDAAISVLPFKETGRYKDGDGYVYFDVATSNSTTVDVVGFQMPGV